MIEAIRNLQNQEITELEPEYEEIKKLDYKQKIAATRKDGNYLVLAGPGSGKTYTLVYRVAFLLASEINPQEICIITFTRKAAEELKVRLRAFYPDVELGFIGTFHALANQILMRKNLLESYRLIDPEDDKMVLKLVIAENEIKFDENLQARTILKIISYAINTQISINSSIKKLGYEKYLSEEAKLEQLYILYKAYKTHHMYLNYDDILEVLGITCPKIHVEIADAFNFNYLMIDEYQDTNNLQLKFIQALKVPNVMAIGDDFQGIYGFRGANHKIILNFYNDFVDSKMITLDNNYRSAASIVQAINLTIKDSEAGFVKNLTSVTYRQGLVKIIANNEDNDQKILNDIKVNIEERNAVIYRQSVMKNDIEKLLIANNLDYVIYGGIRLLERKHTKDIFAILLTSQNTDDFISHLRSLTLLEGIGEGKAKKIISGETVSVKDEEKLEQLQELINNPEPNLQENLKKIIVFYATLSKVIVDSKYSEEEIIADFQLIFDLAEDYDDISHFINDIVLDGSKDARKGNKCKIVLTTIHSAKGLEFDNVHFLYSPNYYGNYSEESLEEERRLFYVAISRAKDTLKIYDYKREQRTLNDILADFKISKENINYSHLVEEEPTIPQFESLKREPQEAKPVSQPKEELSKKGHVIENKSKTTFLILWFFLGIFGGHRFYLKHYTIGTLYLLTFGLFFIGWLTDLRYLRYQFIAKDE